MPSYMMIHPFVGLMAVGLIVAAFIMKVGRRKFWGLHYWTGGAAFLVAGTALTIAILAIMRRTVETDGHMGLPPVVLVHLLLAIFGLLSLLMQVGLGLAMRYVLGGPPRFYRFHKLNSRILILIAAAILGFGLLTLGTMIL